MGDYLASNCSAVSFDQCSYRGGGYDSTWPQAKRSTRYTDWSSQKFDAVADLDAKECLMGVHAMPYTDKELQDIAFVLLAALTPVIEQGLQHHR